MDGGEIICASLDQRRVPERVARACRAALETWTKVQAKRISAGTKRHRHTMRSSIVAGRENERIVQAAPEKERERDGGGRVGGRREEGERGGERISNQLLEERKRREARDRSTFSRGTLHFFVQVARYTPITKGRGGWIKPAECFVGLTIGKRGNCAQLLRHCLVCYCYCCCCCCCGPASSRS